LPETRDFFEANSLTRVDLPPQQFGELIQSDLKHWTTIINTVGVKIE
jgi:tripartite-type tricarboxylate transporter receptor subunit TctC